VQELYNLREFIELPMTVMVDEALEQYVLNFYNMILEPEFPLDVQAMPPLISDEEWANILVQHDQYVGEVDSSTRP
jgi:hypothetical protein